jgi:hypothetical protein
MRGWNGAYRRKEYLLSLNLMHPPRLCIRILLDIAHMMNVYATDGAITPFEFTKPICAEGEEIDECHIKVRCCSMNGAHLIVIAPQGYVTCTLAVIHRPQSVSLDAVRITWVDGCACDIDT